MNPRPNLKWMWMRVEKTYNNNFSSKFNALMSSMDTDLRFSSPQQISASHFFVAIMVSEETEKVQTSFRAMTMFALYGDGEYGIRLWSVIKHMRGKLHELFTTHEK